MSFHADHISPVANESEWVHEHWNEWPNEKGFDPDYEIRSPIELTVIGEMPQYASGTLYRTGPGKSQVETDSGELFKLSHWFDGFGQTHRFQIMSTDKPGSPTRVFYNSRLATDALIEHVVKTNSLGFAGFGQKRDPCQQIFHKMQTEFDPQADPSSVNCGITLSVNMPGLEEVSSGEDFEGRWTTSNKVRSLYAKSDVNIFKKLDPETLEPISLATQNLFHSDLNGPFTASHARSDPVTGDVFNYNLSVQPSSTYRVFCVSGSTGKTTILATFQGTPAYIHSLFITEDYVVLCVWNSHINVSKLGKGPFTDSIIPMDSSKPAKWYIVDRKHNQGLISTYESPAFFSFHTINAWQEVSELDPSKLDIVADIVCTDSTNFLSSVLYENMKSSLASAKQFAANRGDDKRTTISRFRLHSVPSRPSSKTGTATMEWSLCRALSPELPTMNPRFVTRKYRYVYSATFRGEATVTDGILKLDLETREMRLWSQHGHSPGEPIFVPNPDGAGEDSGVLLSVVLDGIRGHSYLLCLDAKDLKELGRANVDGPVAFGFHGQHVPIVGKPTGDY